jgi:hypothetical protein
MDTDLIYKVWAWDELHPEVKQPPPEKPRISSEQNQTEGWIMLGLIVGFFALLWINEKNLHKNEK